MRPGEKHARLVARTTYFWAWPIVNICNRRRPLRFVREPGLLGGIVPVAPINRLSMLSDYIDAGFRKLACPNQDVIYGSAALDLRVSPVVLQVPNFGERFWVFQAVDARTDSFADLGAMYGTQSGFYLLAGPEWNGDMPPGIVGVFRSTTHAGFVIPRVFQDDTPQDRRAIQPLINSIDLYPLADYDGRMKVHDWSRQPTFPLFASGEGETRWVIPERFFDDLTEVLQDVPPLPGEESRYTEVLAVIAAARDDPALKRAMIDEVVRTDSDVIEPLFHFRNWGLKLPHHWSTIHNGGMFGTDYFTRTAVARSNILVNKPNETRYFYQDLDADGVRLNGGVSYALTFAKDELPPVRGFWSLTLYNQHHFFAPNDINRHSLGTKNKELRRNADRSLTIHVQADSPGAEKEDNWLPAPAGEDFSLYLRAYWPDTGITEGNWAPPAVTRVVGARTP